MNSNQKLQIDVQNALQWEPALNSAIIGVTAKDGVVTLSGTVDSYFKKVNAENAVKNVIGVKAIAEDISVKYSSFFNKNDTDVATDVLHAWKSSWDVPEDKIKAKVENGWVQLEGTVDWGYQKEAAQKAINNLAGVKGVTNSIAVQSLSNDKIEKESIQKALMRNWAINSKDIKVEVDKNKVKLTGVVHSLYQKEEAGRLAWNAKGVGAVDNELAVINP